MPGGKLSHRPLHFFWIVDCSSSMGVDGTIQALNAAIREVVPAMRDAAKGHPEVAVKVRAVSFSSGAQWHVSQETPVEDFEWRDLSAKGATNLGRAIDLVIDALDTEKMGDRGIGPVFVLVLGSQPTDDWRNSLDKLNRLPWGRKAVRISIAVGQGADRDVLQAFINNPDMEILDVSRMGQLFSFIEWSHPGAAGIVYTVSDYHPIDADPGVPPHQCNVW